MSLYGRSVAHCRIPTGSNLGFYVAIKVLPTRTASDPKRISASRTSHSLTSEGRNRVL